MQAKFAVRDFDGAPRKFFLVDTEVLPLSTPAPQPSHHILVLDVSGSMYCDMASLKTTVEKVLTLEEFTNEALKVSLLTYSSHGGCRKHFVKVPVASVMAPGSPYIKEVRALSTRGMTGISQALSVAETLIDDSEITCVSLHTDGYANDPSPFAEHRGISEAVKRLQKHPNVFCNTVAYRDYCDFPMLASIANALSGTAVQARDIKQVYQALHDTTALLTGNLSSTLDVGVGSFDLVAFLSRAGEKVLGSRASLQVRGVAAGHDKSVFRYKQVDEGAYLASDAPLDETTPLLAYARVMVALGNLTEAKYAMVTTRNASFYGHARALVASDVALMVTDLEKALFSTGPAPEVRATYGLPDKGPSVLDVLRVLNEHASSVSVNVEALAQGYVRRGLRKVTGRRKDDGSIEKPNVTLRPRTGDNWWALQGVEFSRSKANANILVQRSADLVNVASGEVISSLADVPLDLKEYRNFTVVSNGQVSITSLPIRIQSRDLYEELTRMGALKHTGEFQPGVEGVVTLEDRPLVAYSAKFDLPKGLFNTLSKLTVVEKVLNGILKGVSLDLLPEQIQTLAEHHITPALYFSPPTTVPYTDLTEAVTRGEVDSRTAYEVDFGTPQITSLSKLKSGNAYLQRRFTYTDPSGVEVGKPTLELWGTPGGTWQRKSLSARIKIDAVDDVMNPIFEAFLGLDSRFLESELPNLLGWSLDDVDSLVVALGYDPNETMEEEDARAVLTVLQKAVRNTLQGYFTKVVSPLTFYVGSTGLVPDAWEAPVLSADMLAAKHPGISLSKAEKEEGLFFEVPGGHLLTVTMASDYFSTEIGAKVAASL
jgi:hypothetical protein